VHGSAAVAGKGGSHLTSATMMIKAGITCGHAATVQRQPPQAVDHPWSWPQRRCDLTG
jgi:hypothetical protein